MAKTHAYASQAPGPSRLREELIQFHGKYVGLVEEVGSILIWRRLSEDWQPLP